MISIADRPIANRIIELIQRVENGSKALGECSPEVDELITAKTEELTAEYKAIMRANVITFDDIKEYQND